MFFSMIKLVPKCNPTSLTILRYKGLPEHLGSNSFIILKGYGTVIKKCFLIVQWSSYEYRCYSRDSFEVAGMRLLNTKQWPFAKPLSFIHRETLIFALPLSLMYTEKQWYLICPCHWCTQGNNDICFALLIDVQRETIIFALPFSLMYTEKQWYLLWPSHWCTQRNNDICFALVIDVHRETIIFALPFSLMYTGKQLMIFTLPFSLMYTGKQWYLLCPCHWCTQGNNDICFTLVIDVRRETMIFAFPLSLMCLGKQWYLLSPCHWCDQGNNNYSFCPYI